MSRDDAIAVGGARTRFDRFEAILWWDQRRLSEARVLVVGAGAIGNEVIKNLSLLGVGHLLVVDMDSVDPTNLTRSVLFRPEQVGRPKAAAAAAAARSLYPAIDCEAIVGNVQADVGLGWFRWADVVVGAVDNREARLFINQACALTGRVWIDGGIDVLSGVVRAFAPPDTACYECTMSQADWDLVNARRSCSLLARQALEHGGVPTTPTTASIIGAMQVQEVLKRLHGMESLSGSGFVYEGLHHSSYPVEYTVKPGCPWHEAPPPIERVESLGLDSALGEIWDNATQRLGPPDAIDLSRELVLAIDCPACGSTRDVAAPLDRLTVEQVVCGGCGAEGVPRMLHSIAAGSPWLERTPRELGLPDRDIVWPRCGARALGIELASGRPAPGAVIPEESR